MPSLQVRQLRFRERTSPAPGHIGRKSLETEFETIALANFRTRAHEAKSPLLSHKSGQGRGAGEGVLGISVS